MAFRRLRAARSRQDRTRDVLLVVVLLAAIAAGWFGWSWWSAAHDDGLARAGTRDTVLREATQALVTLNTVNYRTAERDIGNWAEVSAGHFGKRLAEQRKAQIEQVKKAKTVATATVANAAVTELHMRKGTAHVMAVLDIRMRGEGKQQRARHSLLEVELTRAGHSWKVKAVQAAR